MKRGRKSRPGAAAFAFTPIEVKLLRLGLDQAAAEGEIQNCGAKLLACLRKRGITADTFLAPATKSVDQSADSGRVDYRRVRISFGKFQGLPLAQIDPSYLAWVSKNCRESKPEMCRVIDLFLAQVGYNREGDVK
jgi:uncharacterized protein (DUF3820 family)